jgi:hypothetical protein
MCLDSSVFRHVIRDMEKLDNNVVYVYLDIGISSLHIIRNYDMTRDRTCKKWKKTEAPFL